MSTDRSSTTSLRPNIPTEVTGRLMCESNSPARALSGGTRHVYKTEHNSIDGSAKSCGRRGVKRAIDIVLAVVILIITMPPVMLIVSLLLLGGQAPFFVHRRIGRNGRPFGCLKFRTMVRNADNVLAVALASDPQMREEWVLHRKLRNDPRVTRMGRLLRTFSLDELPQLFNVLAGHMSLVGPRPVTTDELATFYTPSEAALYQSARPGLTGLWQVSGRSDTSYSTRVKLDCHYVRHPSIRADFIILARTVWVVLCSRGAR